MNKYIFVYRDLFKLEVYADSYSEALRKLADKKEPVFGMHPLDFDNYDVEYYGTDFN